MGYTRSSARAEYGSLPFAEQIRFFRDKLNLPTAAWTDIFNEAHDHAFVIAGALRDALISDLRGAVDEVIAEGVTITTFRRRFDGVVKRHGWSYKGGRNWRTNVIYDTNLRQSHNAGRFNQQKEAAATRPYWRYRHNDGVSNPRPEHQAWDGIILPHDAPWWDTHYPSNGWGCQCYVESLSPRDAQRLGGVGEAPPIQWEDRVVGERGPTPRTVRTPNGIDPGFGYTPGRSALEWRNRRRGEG